MKKDLIFLLCLIILEGLLLATFAPVGLAQNFSATKNHGQVQNQKALAGGHWFQNEFMRRPPSQSTIHGNQLQKNAILSSRDGTKAAQAKPKKPLKPSSPLPGSLQFSYDQTKASWSSSPKDNVLPNDENLGISEEHHLRAHTHLDQSENLDITAGPELIVKDRKLNPSLKSSNRVDSELGVGMRFNYKF